MRRRRRRQYERARVSTALCFFNQLILFSCLFNTKCKLQFLFNSGNYCFHTDTRMWSAIKQRRFAILYMAYVCKSSLSEKVLYNSIFLLLCAIFALLSQYHPRNSNYYYYNAFIEHISWLILCMSRVFDTFVVTWINVDFISIWLLFL